MPEVDPIGLRLQNYKQRLYVIQKKRKKLKLVRLPDNHDGVAVEPKKGTNTLYWWSKGDDQNGWYVKADLYDINGENTECLIAKNF